MVNERLGIIVKALSGYYYVVPCDKNLQQVFQYEKPIQCRARGIFKKRGESPLVGDFVRYTLTENDEGIVDAIESRTSALIRPPVANANVAVLVFSVTEPALNLQLLDKFLVHIEHSGLQAVLCLSKTDLADHGAQAEEARLAMEQVKRIYEPLGYPVYSTSSMQSNGIEALHEQLQGHVAVFAGQSGVGKSSLLNALVPGLQLATNEISDRLGRGKHTTRHVELIRVGSGFVADTPGFSQLDFVELGIEDLSSCFREMNALASQCKFRGCTHLHEPQCAVLESLDAGEVAKSRYEHYQLFVAEMKEKRRKY